MKTINIGDLMVIKAKEIVGEITLAMVANGKKYYYLECNNNHSGWYKNQQLDKHSKND